MLRSSIELIKSAFLLLKSFFSSSLFYILLGCLFLYISNIQMSLMHPAYLFLITVLGVSLVLFGTGSSGTGSADAQGIKVAVAGGSAVIALVVGWGVIHYQEKIKSLFESNYLLGLAKIDFDRPIDSYNISAKLESGRNLYLLKDKYRVELLVPLFYRDTSSNISLEITNLDQKPILFSSNGQTIGRSLVPLLWESRDTTKSGLDHFAPMTTHLNFQIATITQIVDPERPTTPQNIVFTPQ